MELLFCDELRRALADPLTLSELPGVKDLLPDLGQIQAEEPGDPAFGFVASGVAFSLAKQLEARGFSAISPELIAGHLCRVVKGFSVSVGGGGFINAQPAPELIEHFFSDVRLREFPYSPGAISVDWENRYLKKALAGPDGEESRLFCKALEERGQKELSRDDAIQFLALLGDGELEAAPFLNGFGGRHNVSWYLRRFEQAAETFGAPARLEPALFTDTHYRRLIASALHFRGRFRTHIGKQRPERALRETLALTADFFAVYNRPEVRADPARGGLSRIFEAVAGLIFGALQSMKLPCEVPGRVL